MALSDKIGQAVGQKTGSQSLATVARIALKFALGLSLVATGSIKINGLAISVAVPAACYVASDALARHLGRGGG